MIDSVVEFLTAMIIFIESLVHIEMQMTSAQRTFDLTDLPAEPTEDEIQNRHSKIIGKRKSI